MTRRYELLEVLETGDMTSAELLTHLRARRTGWAAPAVRKYISEALQSSEAWICDLGCGNHLRPRRYTVVRGHAVAAVPERTERRRRDGPLSTASATTLQASAIRSRCPLELAWAGIAA